MNDFTKKINEQLPPTDSLAHNILKVYTISGKAIYSDFPSTEKLFEKAKQDEFLDLTFRDTKTFFSSTQDTSVSVGRLGDFDVYSLLRSEHYAGSGLSNEIFVFEAELEFALKMCGVFNQIWDNPS